MTGELPVLSLACPASTTPSEETVSMVVSEQETLPEQQGDSVAET